METENRVYMDSCCFIDMAKMAKITHLNKNTHDPTGRTEDVWYLRRLCDAARAGDIEIISSTLAIAECLHDGNRDKIDDTAKDLFEKYLTSGSVVLPIEAGYDVCVQARDLFWRHGILLSGADQVHLASAIETNCRELITTDEKIQTRQKFHDAIAPIEKILGITVIRASATTILPGKYRQVQAGI